MSIPHGHSNRNARYAESEHPGAELNLSKEQPKKKTALHKGCSI